MRRLFTILFLLVALIADAAETNPPAIRRTFMTTNSAVGSMTNWQVPMLSNGVWVGRNTNEFGGGGGGGGGGTDRIEKDAGHGTNTTLHTRLEIKGGSGTNSLVVGTNQLVVTNGNVGIGTANPTAKLHVNGGAVLGGTLTLGSGATFTESTIGLVDGGSITDIGSSVPGGVRLGALQLTTGAGAGLLGVSDGSGNHGWGPHTNSFVRTNEIAFANEYIVDGSHRLASDTGPIFRHITNINGRIVNNSLVKVYGRYTNWLTTNSATAVRASLMLTNLTNVVIRNAGGAWVYGPEYGNHIYVNSCDGLTIDGLTAEGGKTNLQNNFAANDLCAVVLIWGTNNNVKVINNNILHYFQHGIMEFGLNSIAYSQGTVVRNNWFDDGGTTNHATLGVDGAAIVNLGAGAQIIGNRGRRVARAIEYQATAATGSRLDGWEISYNVFDEIFGDFGIFTAPPVSNIASSNMSQGLIQGNVIRGTPTRYDFYGISIRFGERINIVDNLVQHCYEGIEVRATLYDVLNIGLFNNNVSYIRANGFGRGIRLADSGGAGVLAGVRASGNRVKKVYNGGIVVNGGRDIVLERNDLLDCGQEAAESPIHFYSDEGAKTNMVLRGNQIRTEEAVTATVGITVPSGFTAILDGNHVNGYATPVSFAGTPGTVSEYLNRDIHRGIFSVSNTVQAGSVTVTNAITGLGTTFLNQLWATGGVTHLSWTAVIGLQTNHATWRGTNIFDAGWLHVGGAQTNIGKLTVNDEARFDVGLTSGEFVRTEWLQVTNDTELRGLVTAGNLVSVNSITATNDAHFMGSIKRDIETFDTSIDWGAGNSYVRDWTNNLTITFANVTDGRGVWLYLTNNGSTAAFTLAFPAGIIWINHRDQNSTPNFDRRPSIVQAVYFYRRSGVTYAEGPNGPDYNPVFTYGVYTNTSATTVILDPNNGSYQRLVAAHNILLLHTNAVAQRIYNFQLDFVQDGTGVRTVTFGTNAAGQFWKASGGTPSITTNANAESVLTIRSDGTGTNMFVLSSTNFTRL